MGLIADHGGDFGGRDYEYEAVALPAPAGADIDAGSAVFVRRSVRPSRRAVLHLHELSDSLAPADLVRWYNERGFHFYLTDVERAESQSSAWRGSVAKSPRSAFASLDAACAYLREADGIDAIILSAQDASALTAALWCDARPVTRPVDALILSAPDFGRARVRLDIACPVLVISAAGQWRDTRRKQRGGEGIRLGQHVTWLQIDASAGEGGRPGVPSPGRRRLFDEMGRWLGAYMYGQVRDQLL
ncbi:MAG TPA: hypothetical protein VFQ44_13015 [Streptosporangiaceae bacterium]|nr:hypothetical protein [Streptosporangiaceae bacterium]